MEKQYIDIIHDVYPSLSQSEKRVADYVMENVTNILRMSSRELRDAVNVSEPTIFRFCRTLGFTGFRDFKISMAQQTSTFKNYFLSNDSFESNLQALIHRALQSEIKVIETTLKMLDYALLEKIAKSILAAKRICLFGAGASILACNDARRKFSRLGINAWSFSDFHDAFPILGTFAKQDMLIAVSHLGITRETENVLRFTFNRKASTVLLTAYPNTRMRPYVNTILRTYAQETVDNRIVGAARLSQFVMLDALFIAVASMLCDDELHMIEQTSREIKNTLN